MESIKKQIPLAIRILISFLFFLSAVAKLFPNPSFAITYFEVHQLEPMGISLKLTHYISRTLIGVEFAIGFLLLFPFYLKKVVIPVTIGMLALFVGELAYEIIKNGNSGNCGCFGELIKMTPLEALIKNVLSIGLLILLYFIPSKKQSNSDEVVDSESVAEPLNPYKSKYHAMAVSNVVTLCVLGIFLIAPFRDEQKDPVAPIPMVSEPTHSHIDTIKIDGVKTSIVDTVKLVKPIGPKPKKSGFANIFTGIDEGKKILCFFAPGCDHCRETAKQLTALKKQNPDFPAMSIIFMDEAPEEIPAFFKFAGNEYPYYVMDIVTFWGKLGENKDVPGVLYLWNGNKKKFYQGIDKEKFNDQEFKKIINKKS